MPYTDQSLLLAGKEHKFKKLCNVPPDYLLELYRNRAALKDKDLVKYLEDNYQKFLNNPEGLLKKVPSGLGYKTQGKRTVVTCAVTNKIIFPNQAAAKQELKRIRNSSQDNKKPIRTYECNHCSGWHLTSKPHNKFK